ncbi:hypothetical protein [Streptomyces sp. MJM8645]|uniref:hypothetical protein n=1 Tax=Streptomycetaceae TaxID=2062 RepID=UPI0007AF7376|nr:hypothetical protein [Streptomyces sp. MJM8645]
MNHPGGIIPAPLRIAVEREFGPVLHIEERPGGHTPGVCAALTLTHRRVFLKAIAVCHPFSKDHQLEAGINSVLPPGLGPRLLWSDTVDGWLALVFEHVDGRRPDLSPRSPDIPMVLDKISMLIDVLTPSPFAGAAPIGAHRAYRAVPAEILAGDTLLHCSPRPDNLIINSEVHVIDWGSSRLGVGWLVAAFMVPHFIVAGHSPRGAEALVQTVPAFKEAPGEAVTIVARVLATYWSGRIDHYPPGALYDYRVRAAHAAGSWADHCDTP